MTNDKNDRNIQQIFAALLAGFSVGASIAQTTSLGTTPGIVIGILMFGGYLFVAWGGPGVMDKPFHSISAAVMSLGVLYVTAVWMRIPLPLAIAVSWVAWNGFLRGLHSKWPDKGAPEHPGEHVVSERHPK